MPAEASSHSFEYCAVDGHVHIYPFMRVDAVLDAGGQNLLPSCDGLQDDRWAGLLVADPEGVDGYERLLRHDGQPGAQPFWRREQGDRHSVTFRHTSGRRIVAFRGQQLISSEGLEVLGIGHGGDLSSGLTLGAVVDRITAGGGWAIIAWGVGKWLGRRGREVTGMIAAEGGRPDVMLADNAGRPLFWSHVPQFDLAREKGMRIVAGTDPLPLEGEEKRVGSYGFRVRVGSGNGQSMKHAFVRAIEDPETSVEPIGTRIAAGRFVSNQLRLRLSRRSRQFSDSS